MRGADEAELAHRFHRTMADAIVEGAGRLAEEESISHVALGGGVFQNQLLLGDGRGRASDQRGSCSAPAA